MPQGAELCLQGLTFVITGILDSLEREQADELIRTYGGRTTGSVSGKTSYLVTGVEAGDKKIQDAKDKKVHNTRSCLWWW